MSVVQIKPMTEDRMVYYLAHHFDFIRQIIVPNCHFAGTEMDLLVLSPQRYLTEIEVKCSLADWQNDQKKAKWAHPERDKIKRFFYAVPHNLVDKVPSWVPTTAGLLVVSPQGWVTEFRKASPTSKYKVTDEEILFLYRKMYSRYWTIRNRIKNPKNDKFGPTSYNYGLAQGVNVDEE